MGVEMGTILLTIFLAFAQGQTAQEPSTAQKKDFIELLRALPVQGEFYTEDAIRRASPHLPVLLVLTEQDIERFDIYPFLALSRGLANHREQQDYVVRHFAAIRHPVIKLFWGAVLFKEGVASAQIVRYLRAALEVEEQRNLLAEMLGPEFEEFQRRVRATP